ncbi:rhodanese-like domain-containing protein [Lacimicrobium sp. SS2-24]|uniref:rhodanese-like domain-containing protein n=1 Tax=Lacimicrobium sp. SS2-24 TaxID=2005569 RepID=UPI000B4BAF54|nr:rhodanese-like domain-containing protein [Lacimicrobium sp. SS2-24]
MQQLIEFVGNHYILSSIWVALALMFIFSLISGRLSPVKELGTLEMTMLMNKQDAVVLDIRPQPDYRKGHILGARQVGAEKMAKGDFSDLEKYKDKPIIVVCAMGVSAKRTASQLLKSGFNQVFVLKGGMNAWTSASMPVAK